MTEQEKRIEELEVALKDSMQLIAKLEHALVPFVAALEAGKKEAYDNLTYGDYKQAEKILMQLKTKRI